MKEITGNIWEVEGDWICIPTNGFVKSDGTAVMGRGLAKQARQKFPGIEITLGRSLIATGNIIHVLRRKEKEPVLLSFPTKEDWRDPADLELIQNSCRELRSYWRGAQLVDKNPKTVLLPRVGSGNGRLEWPKVKALLEVELPEDSFVVVSLV